MRLALAFVLRNWPLKLAALFLATVLYAGLVLAQNTRTFPARVPIEPIRPPAGASILDSLPDVTTIRYRAPVDVASRISNDDFHASVDLAGIVAQPGGTPVQVRVSVVPVDDRIEVIDWVPRSVTIRLDPVVTRPQSVTIQRSGTPEGLTIGPTVIQPGFVSVSGPSSRVLSIRRVEGRVTIDGSAINIDTDVDVLAVDDRGQEVPQIQIQPDRVHVHIEIARVLANRTVPVVPQLSGAPPPGYRIGTVSLKPLVVTLSGEQPLVAVIESISTLPIDVSDQTASFDAHIGLDLPAEVSIAGASEITVTVEISQDEGSRTYTAGLSLLSARSDLLYALSVPQVLVTLSGPLALLDSLSPQELSATVDVQGLGPGEHDLPVRVRAPAGTQLGTIVPPRVTVTITGPPATPSPAATPSPSAPSPGASASPQGVAGTFH